MYSDLPGPPGPPDPPEPPDPLADIDVPKLDPFEEVEEREFSLRLHRGASFTSMASSAAGDAAVSKELTHNLPLCHSVCLCSQTAEKKVPPAISFSKQHSQSEATPTNPTPFTRLDSEDSSRSSGRSSSSSALSGMVSSLSLSPFLSLSPSLSLSLSLSPPPPPPPSLSLSLYES